MIKKLTIALLLFSTGTLFAQITSPEPTTFLVKTLEGVEADMLLTRIGGERFNLSELFKLNVLPVALQTDDYGSWADENWDVGGDDGVHGDDASNKKTDAQGISLTGTEAGSGVHLINTLDMATTAAGDTLENWYFNIAIFVPTGDSAKLAGNAIDIVFPCDTESTLTNYFLYTITDQQIADNDWTYFKITKSVFEDSTVGSPTWDAVKGISLQLADAPSAEVTITFDAGQLVRPDPDTAEPNPLQREGPNGTWVAVWTQEGAENGWLVEESGRLSIMSPGAYTSSIKSVNSYGDYALSGRMILGSAGATDFMSPSATLRYLQTIEGSNLLRVADSTGSTHDIAFVCAAGDEVGFEITRKGTSITLAATKDDISWATNSSFCYSGVQQIVMRLSTGQRILNFGFSTVDYASGAGVAQRLEGIHFHRGAEGLEITIGDSTYFMVIDSVQ